MGDTDDKDRPEVPETDRDPELQDLRLARCLRGLARIAPEAFGRLDSFAAVLKEFEEREQAELAASELSISHNLKFLRRIPAPFRLWGRIRLRLATDLVLPRRLAVMGQWRKAACAVFFLGVLSSAFFSRISVRQDAEVASVLPTLVVDLSEAGGELSSRDQAALWTMVRGRMVFCVPQLLGEGR